MNISLNGLTSVVGIKEGVVEQSIVDSLEIEAEIKLSVNMFGQNGLLEGEELGYGDLRCVAGRVKGTHYLPRGIIILSKSID